MSYRTELSTLEALASRLPFRLEEAEQVNEAFSIYMVEGTRQQKILIDLWTYCYVRKYFLIKFLRRGAFQASELDQLVEKTYQKIERHRTNVLSHDRYAQWVSLICRNTFINFVSRRKMIVGLDVLPGEPSAAPDLLDLDANSASIHLSLLNAIDALPEFLQSTARMKFVENLSYEEISRIIGKRVPTVRSYVHKICKRFRKDSALRSWADQLFQ